MFLTDRQNRLLLAEDWTKIYRFATQNPVL